jgi:hypothetical protein
VTDKPRCAARSSQTGKPCKLWPVKGAAVCHKHGGRAPQVKANAAVRVAEEEITAAAERYAAAAGPVEDPLSVLLKLAGEIAGFKDFIAARVAELRAEQWRYRGLHAEQLRAELGLYERALDRTARVLVDINKLKLEERMVKLTERQGDLIAEVIRRVMDDLDLTEEQRAKASVALPRELRRVAAEEDARENASSQ